MSPFWISVLVGIAVVMFVLAWLTAEPEEKRPPQTAASARRAARPDTPATPPAKQSAPAKASAPAKSSAAAALPRMEYEEDEAVDPTKVASKAAVSSAQRAAPIPAKRIVYDEDAAADEPTNAAALILVTATQQTDTGLKRKRNEDSVLVMPEEGVFVVADGMGGYRGGEIASDLAVKTIQKAFRERTFDGEPHPDMPLRASELVRALHSANEAILKRAEKEKELEGMGTTVVAARFSANKQRFFVAHVGDSRMYRLRNGTLNQVTSDHTMRDHGVTGAGSAHLSRAVGIWPVVLVDVIFGIPQAGDIYLLCSDGLTKMVPDSMIAEILGQESEPTDIVDALVHAANTKGGKDNITVIVIRVYGSEHRSTPARAPGREGVRVDNT